MQFSKINKQFQHHGNREFDLITKPLNTLKLLKSVRLRITPKVSIVFFHRQIVTNWILFLGKLKAKKRVLFTKKNIQALFCSNCEEVHQTDLRYKPKLKV